MFRGTNNFLVIPRLFRAVYPVPMASSTTALKGFRNRFDAFVSSYEDFIGVKAVKEAHAGVMMWEEKLSEAQIARRNKQAEIKSLQSRLKEIHAELDRTSRSEDKYLHLLTEEHATIKKERVLLEDFEGLEAAEREAFYQLSNRVRASHEREREQAEKTKWWSVSASLIGALIGVVGASIGNELRMRRLREMLPMGGAQVSELSRLIGEQNTKVTGFIAEMRDILRLNPLPDEPSYKLHFENVSAEKAIAAIREENAKLSAQMGELTRLARLESSLIVDPNSVVYVGSDMERLLDRTEKNLESKMKLQTLLSVVALYAAVAVTIPLIFAIYKGW